MKIREIRLGGDDELLIRLEPRPTGVTVVPVRAPLDAELLVRALRETLSAPRRRALSEMLSIIEIRFEDGAEHMLVQDDARRGRRVLALRTAGSEEQVLAAETHALGDAFATERLLRRIAEVFGLDTAADTSLALARGPHSAESPASPKRLAYQRAFEEVRAIGRNLDSIDRALAKPTRPNWLLVAAIVAGAALAATTFAVAWPRMAGPILGLTMVGLLVYLGRLGLHTLREIDGRKGLPDEMVALRAALDVARERALELAETLRRRGDDPDEILGGLLPSTPTNRAPSLLARTSVSSSELLSIEMMSQQALVLVPSDDVAGDDFGGRVRRPEGLSSGSAVGGAPSGE